MPFFVAHILLLAGFAFVCAVFLVIKDRAKLGDRDPYSIESLRRFEEQEELRKAEEDHDLHSEANTYCVWCGEVYTPEFKVCPRCKR